MRLKYKIKNLWRIIRYAFYPKTALIICIVSAVVIDAVLAVIMLNLDNPSRRYDLVFALLTGVTASFVVSFIIECAGNYRRNNMAFYELDEYFFGIEEFLFSDAIRQKKSITQLAEQMAINEYIAMGGKYEADESDEPLDSVQVVWSALPKLYSLLKITYEQKRAYLSLTEILVIKDILSFWEYIRYNVEDALLDRLQPRALNIPDVDWMHNVFQDNIIQELDDWMLKKLAVKQSRKSIKEICDSIMEDSFMLSYFMRDYDISEESSGRFGNHDLDSDSSYDEEEVEEDEPFEEDMSDEDFVNMRKAENLEIAKWRKNAIEEEISFYCSKIYDQIMVLKEEIRKHPYVGLEIDIREDLSRNIKKSPFTEYVYNKTKERLNREHSD